ncbi:protein SPMIP2 [Macrotis lagotis]|uniref:protein SPMIP2 n=1 Tax=Macrotis lagotis TaxID=92651 RepID=UPI003D694A1A
MAYSLSHRKPFAVGKRMIFTGPDAVKDYKAKLPDNTRYIGEKRPVLEATSELDYLWRPAPNRSFTAREKHSYVGEIGWGIPQFNFINQSRLETGVHLKQGEFRKFMEDTITHRYQNPWQPRPKLLDLQGNCSRAGLAWHLGDYENINERHSRWATAVRSMKGNSMSFSSCPKLPQVTTRHNERSLDCIHTLTTELASELSPEMSPPLVPPLTPPLVPTLTPPLSPPLVPPPPPALAPTSTPLIPVLAPSPSPAPSAVHYL